VLAAPGDAPAAANAAAVLGSGVQNVDGRAVADGTHGEASKEARTVGLGFGAALGDGRNATAAAQGDAAALAGAQAAAGAAQTGDAAALRAAADAAAHAGALQAASAGSGASNVQGSMAAATSAAIAPHVGSAGWDDAFSQKVVFLSNAHQQSAELTLNPKDLGPLQVVLQVADNHAHALFVSQHAQVREAVEAALPKLREAMEANGIGLGSTSVSDGFARQAGQDGGQGSGSGARSGRGGRDAGGFGDVGAVGDTRQVPVRRTVGLVDTFA